MARRTKQTTTSAETETQQTGPRLVEQTVDQKLNQQSDLIVERKIKNIERQKVLGEAKRLLNLIKELDDKIEKSAEKNATERQLSILAEIRKLEENKEGLQGRVLDQSNVVDPEDLETGSDETEEEEA